jgi:hypothetical protein
MQIQRSYIIPFGVNFSAGGHNQIVFFLQRKDHLLPNLWGEIQGRDYCNKLMAVGGGIEETEDPEMAAMREMDEEVPGWFEAARLPAAKIFAGLKVKDFSVYENGIQIIFVAVDVGSMSSRKYIKSTNEGIPAILTLDNILASDDKEWVMPQFKWATERLGKALLANLKN